MRSIRGSAIAIALGAAACGGATGSARDASALTAYQAVGQQMTTTLTAYAADAAAMPDVAACDAAYGRYQGAMPPLAERMREMSQAMDQRMAQAGHPGFDMGCMADAMRAELGHHHAAACAGADLAADRQEAAEHVATMSRFMEHQRVRYQDAGSWMGMMGNPDGTTFSCVENPDGTFTIDGHAWSPGSGAPGTGECQTCDCLGTCAPGTGTGTCPATCTPPTEPWPTPCPDGSCCGGGGGMGGHP